MNTPDSNLAEQVPIPPPPDGLAEWWERHFAEIQAATNPVSLFADVLALGIYRHEPRGMVTMIPIDANMETVRGCTLQGVVWLQTPTRDQRAAIVAQIPNRIANKECWPSAERPNSEFIVSVVMTRIMPTGIVNTQNVLWLIQANDAQEAHEKAAPLAERSFPEHKLHTVCSYSLGHLPNTPDGAPLT